MEEVLSTPSSVWHGAHRQAGRAGGGHALEEVLSTPSSVWHGAPRQAGRAGGGHALEEVLCTTSSEWHGAHRQAGRALRFQQVQATGHCFKHQTDLAQAGPAMPHAFLTWLKQGLWCPHAFLTRALSLPLPVRWQGWVCLQQTSSAMASNRPRSGLGRCTTCSWLSRRQVGITGPG